MRRKLAARQQVPLLPELRDRREYNKLLLPRAICPIDNFRRARAAPPTLGWPKMQESTVDQSGPTPSLATPQLQPSEVQELQSARKRRMTCCIVKTPMQCIQNYAILNRASQWNPPS